MAFRRGFDHNSANNNDYASRKEARQAFQSSIAKFQERQRKRLAETGIEESTSVTEDEPSVIEGGSTADLPLRGPDYSRRLLLPTNQPLDIESIQRVNQLYCAEAKAIDKAQRTTLSLMFSESGEELQSTVSSGRELKEQFEAVYDRMRRTTDRATIASGLTEDPGAKAVPHEFPHLDGMMILEDFFDHCKLPNEAEILMLADVCEVDPEEIEDWFDEKLKEDWGMFRSSKRVMNKEPTGSLHRKQ